MKKHFKLNNEVEVPEIGFGTWQIADGDAVVNAVKSAINVGYRHIDAAAVYNNEKGVGIGIKESGIERKELFVTSKLWNTQRGYESTLNAFDKTLKDLHLDYLDLYLIHWPATAHHFDNWQQINSDTWRAMEKLYKDGKVRAIGVSNFMVHHLEPLLANAKIKPAVNQIEFHPGYMQEECVKFCKKNNILVEGWSPLGRGIVLGHELLKEIAGKYNKSVAQLCIRWALQHGVLPLPKSSTVSRIKENFEVFDFEIAASDMDLINKMGSAGESGLYPDKVDF
jgi:diketogulonate reductase-like aldo/keto reductase